MTELLSSNCAKLSVIKSVMDQFHAHCGTAEVMPITPNVSMDYGNVDPDEVINFSNTLKQGISQHLLGAPEDEVIATFQDALKQRAGLLVSPEVRNEGGGDVDVYLRNVIDRRDSIEETIEATVTLHSNSLDPHYIGEQSLVSEGEAPEFREQPIL